MNDVKVVNATITELENDPCHELNRAFVFSDFLKQRHKSLLGNIVDICIYPRKRNIYLFSNNESKLYPSVNL